MLTMEEAMCPEEGREGRRAWDHGESFYFLHLSFTVKVKNVLK